MIPLLTLMACGLFDSASTPPVPTPPSTVPAPTAPAAPAVTAPAADPAADPTAADPTATASSAPLATAQAPGHCAEGQHTWFQCAVGQGRTVSLCGDAEPTWLQYHFGPPGAAALTVPATVAGLKRFRFAEQSWAQAQAQAVRFDNEGVTYLLVDKAGSGNDGQLNNFQGVVVREGDKEVARFACLGNLEATGLPALSGRLEALGYSD